METVTFAILGMGCSCEGKIVEKRVKALPGVESFSLNPITNRLNLTYDPAIVSIPEVEKAVRRAGVTAVLLKPK
jgi:Cu+-exporting ATPase